MGLVLAVLALLVTIVVLSFEATAAAMSRRFCLKELSFWPTLVFGTVVSALLAASHFAHWSW
jgi:hypothetical protein